MRDTWVWLAIVAAVALTALVLLRSELRRPGSAAPAGATPPAAGAAPGEIRIASGETILLDAAALEPGRPIVVQLRLGEPSRSEEPLPVRLIGPDGSTHEGRGVLDAERMQARFEIDPAWLAWGVNIVEVKTTEASHFPLRRYTLELR